MVRNANYICCQLVFHNFWSTLILVRFLNNHHTTTVVWHEGPLLAKLFDYNAIMQLESLTQQTSIYNHAYHDSMMFIIYFLYIHTGSHEYGWWQIVKHCWYNHRLFLESLTDVLLLVKARWVIMNASYAT